MSGRHWQRILTLTALVLMEEMLGPAPRVRAQGLDPAERYQQPAGVSQRITDEAICARVNRAMASDPLAAAGLVQVRSDGGLVTLRGTVPNLGARGRAGVLAQQTPGVLGVINELVVMGDVVPSDSAIRREVESALRRAGSFEFPRVQVRVEKGLVRLNGRVRTEPMRAWATEIARNVSNVTDVRNDILVGYETVPSDAQIRDRVRSALAREGLFEPEFLRVFVRSGRVVLSGLVANVEERERAIAAAWTAGATSVDASDLRDTAEGDSLAPRDKYVLPTDREVRSLVESALVGDERVNPFRIEATVMGRIVTLRGEVDDLVARRAAEQVALGVVGVRGVINQIQVARAERTVPESLRGTGSRDQKSMAPGPRGTGNARNASP